MHSFIVFFLYRCRFKKYTWVLFVLKLSGSSVIVNPWGGGGGVVRPSSRLMGCVAGWGCIFMAGLTIMGLHLHYPYYRIVHFRDLRDQRIQVYSRNLKTIFTSLSLTNVSIYFRMSYLVKRLYKERQLLSWDRENYIFLKVTNMGSIFGHRLDYNR